MATRLTLLCHARLLRHGDLRFPADEPIDPVALRKISAAALQLGGHARLETAPELRARQTAEAIGHDAIISAALRDCDYGTWRGRSLEDIGASDPAGTAAWLADPAAAPHGGESVLDLLSRIGTWLENDPEQDRTLAITHPAVIRAAIVHCLGAPPQAFWRIDIEPMSVTELSRHAGRWNLRSMGRAWL